jgi:hypothetical protein
MIAGYLTVSFIVIPYLVLIFVSLSTPKEYFITEYISEMPPINPLSIPIFIEP